MTAPLRSRLGLERSWFGSPFRATNRAVGPVKQGKNWSRAPFVYYRKLSPGESGELQAVATMVVFRPRFRAWLRVLWSSHWCRAPSARSRLGVCFFSQPGPSLPRPGGHHEDQAKSKWEEKHLRPERPEETQERQAGAASDTRGRSRDRHRIGGALCGGTAGEGPRACTAFPFLHAGFACAGRLDGAMPR